MNSEAIFNMAHKKGIEAVGELDVIPMVVVQCENPLDDNSDIVKTWSVSDGVCGFAWVRICPANSKFAKYLLFNGLARKNSYSGGVNMWIHDFNQSMQKKEAYAYAFAQELREHAIKAYAESRMD